ncbi:hypothetical protein L6452_33397 [Arctium lappa]|uniref:Uncharacterized protein n=1 Tax=Arctium lappa TaxID=4217 RepID=A0ACB8YFY7_ARCLA|nr:hypothetical protein L6452_33397 [Arctium lappa]
MEIESKNGFKTRLQKGSETFDFGRELGFNSTDRTVSRRHISFKLHEEDRSKVYFEVKGKNPVWVRDRTNDEIRVYKRSERGEMKAGDSFCVSSKNPNWFNLKKIASEDEEDDESNSELRFDDVLAETSGSGIGYDEIDTGDVSHIDPVKEFNFVVMGHEFDCYPKKMIRDIRNWDWFLEEPKEKSDDDDDDDDSKRNAKKGTKKRKKGRGKDNNDDDVWTGESEDDAEMIKKLKNVPKPKYSTRSKNQGKNKKGKSPSVSKSPKNAKDEEEEEDDEDEDDETLGGFIVDDEETREGDNEDDDEEEEEFEEDECDDE